MDFERLEMNVHLALRTVKTAFLIALAACACLATAQTPHHAHWTAAIEPVDTRAGEVGFVVMHATIDPGWHIYSLSNTADATPTTFTIPAGILEAAGAPQSDKPIVKFDSNFGAQTAIHEGQADFRVPVRIAKASTGSQQAKITVRYQACDPKQCARPLTEDVPITFTVASGDARPDRSKELGATASTTPNQSTPTDEFSRKYQAAEGAGLFAFLWFAFVLGLYSLVTPCVFPMIPITVSFFTKGRAEGGKTNYSGALAYCLGIIGTFTAIGLITTAIFGATGINHLATNPWVNLALAVLFIALALSLFGLFDIGIPNSVLNKLNSKARSGTGLIAPVLMGLTFSLTSFTCTVPFVGTILGRAATEGYLYPTLGMLAFSLAFALPFFLLALFPQYLAKLPKSGGWLSTVKASMGFLEIAAALKFLSNTDLVFQLGILTKGVFLAIWTAIAIIGALYLLGAIKLAHDGDTRIGWLRRGFGVLMLGAAGLCLAALQGHSLGKFDAFVPADPYPGRETKANSLYQWETNYDAALTKAKTEHKNVFIDFTGVTCTNCRYMEDNIFPLPRVKERFGQFVLVKLYTDRALKEDTDNAALQDKIAKVSTLPCYVIVSPEGKVLEVHQQQAGIDDEQQFVAALDIGLQNRVSVRP